MKKNKIIGVCLLVLIGIAGYIYILKPKKIEGIKLVKTDFIEKILVSGIVSGIDNSILSTEINGTILDIFFKEGEFVKKGDIIASLRTKDIDVLIKQKKAELLSTEAELEKLETVLIQNAELLFLNSEIEYKNAEIEFQKYFKLYENQYVNILELNEKKNILLEKEIKFKNSLNELNSLKTGPNRKTILANLTQKKEALEYEKEQKQKYNIVAPYDSYIRERYIDIGETVSAYSELFLISSLDEKIVEVDLDERYSDKIKKNDKITIYSFGNENIKEFGEIYFINNSVNERKGTILIKGTLKEKSHHFLYGSTVNIEIDGQKIKDSFFIPKEYFYSKDEKTFVMIYENGKVEEKEISGVHVLDGFVIKDGIDESNIVLNPENLKIGEKIQYEIRN
ncbi:efflux RND transporter periplasmic adaptor subunit [Cetobacterium sp.]|uniref:efflux RND transporter periplasmic adaptor subunit n=1 Tax=Cetobacterium sp. TaxID=2071632 RepID=UPI003F338D59